MDTGALHLISEISRKVDGEHSDILRANAAAVADWVDATEASELKAKVLASVADLQKGLLERDTEVSLFIHAEVYAAQVGAWDAGIRLCFDDSCVPSVSTCGAPCPPAGLTDGLPVQRLSKAALLCALTC